MTGISSFFYKFLVAMSVATFASTVHAQSSGLPLISYSEFLTSSPLEPGTLEQEARPTAGLHIVVIEGEDGVNIIKKKTAVKPVVEVRDRNNLPVAGAFVTFASPGNGPSVVFANGARSITAVTDASGRAMTTGMRPMNAGKFQIQVSASSHSQSATATISMTNALTPAAAGAAGGTAAATGAAGTGLSTGAITAIVIGAVGAAAGVGLAVGLHGGGSAASSTAVTITAGSGGSVGAPHLRRSVHSY